MNVFGAEKFRVEAPLADDCIVVQTMLSLPSQKRLLDEVVASASGASTARLNSVPHSREPLRHSQGNSQILSSSLRVLGALCG